MRTSALLPLVVLLGCAQPTPSAPGGGGSSGWDPLNRDRSTPYVMIDNAGEVSCAPALVNSYRSDTPWAVGSRFVLNVTTQTGSVITSGNLGVLTVVERSRLALPASSLSGAGERISLEVELLAPGTGSVVLRKPADSDGSIVATFEVEQASTLALTVVEGHEYGEPPEERSYGELAVLDGGQSDIALLVRTLAADGSSLCGAPPITSHIADGWSLRGMGDELDAGVDANEIIRLAGPSEPPSSDWNLELEAAGLRTEIGVRVVSREAIRGIEVERIGDDPFRSRARALSEGTVHGGTVEVAAWGVSPSTPTCGAHGRRELDEGGLPVLVLSNSCLTAAPIEVWLRERPETRFEVWVDPDAADPPRLAVSGNGDCDGAHSIPPIGGAFVGMISTYESHFREPSCGSYPGPEGIFELRLDTRQRVRLRAWGRGYDAGLHVRGDLCEEAALTHCAREFGSVATIDGIFEAGAHIIVVDGPVYRRSSGSYSPPRSYDLDVVVSPP